jgi:hypothetical protein
MKYFTQFSKVIIFILLLALSFYQGKAQGVITIGTGAGIEPYVPCYDYYGYSWSETVYLQDDIGCPIMINQIAFNVSNNGIFNMSNEKLYMKLVSYSTIQSTSYPDPANNGYTLVWSGTKTWTYGWNVIPLTTPYVYDGTQNLSIVWEDWDPDWSGGYPYFCYTSVANSCKYKYQDPSFPTTPGYINSYRPNLQIYWVPLQYGTVSGTVTDSFSGFPIPGAKVDAGSVTYTLSDGSYSLEIAAGIHTFHYTEPGYTPQSQAVYITPGESYTIDIPLTEEAVPPFGIVATLGPPNLNMVDVTWDVPNGYYEIIYDDGIFENMTAWLDDGSLNALRFMPTGYPVTLTGGSVNIGDGTYPPGGDQLRDFVIGVFDDDGNDRYPGTFLGSVDVTPTEFGWVSFDLSSLGLTFTSGDFFIAMKQGGNWPDCTPIAIDESYPVYRSYSKFSAGTWVPAGYNDFMIRAICQGPGGVGGEVSRDLMNYSVYRVNEGDEGNPDAWTLVAGFIGADVNTYTDSAWSTLPDGGYRWAVAAHYTGITSEPALSNLLGKNWTAQVTINITTSGGESAEGAQVILENVDGLPEHQYSALCPASGTIVFPEVWKGNYDLLIAKFNYDPYQNLNFSISEDTTLDVVLVEVTTSPIGLMVDALTLIATWFPPGVNLDMMNEGWDSYGFTQNGWTIDPSQSNWQIYSDDGMPAPCAEFHWSPEIYNYDVSLVSKSFSGPGMPNINLDFDLSFSNYSTSTNENMAVEVWNGSTWIQIINYSNQVYTEGIPWTNYLFDISSYVQNSNNFKVRFRAWGENTYNINRWYIDNIYLYGEDTLSVIEYNLYLDGELIGFTTETHFQYPAFLINWGQTYIAGVEAVYASSVSPKTYFMFTSIHLPPPRELEGVNVGHAVYLTWIPPLVGTQPTRPQGGMTWAELLDYNNMTEDDLYQPTVNGIEHIGLAPKNEKPIPMQGPTVLRAITDRCYAYNAYPNYGSDLEAPTKFTLINPGNLESFGPSGYGNFFSGGCWGPGNLWYVTRYNGGFGTVDTTTGNYTQISTGLVNCVGLAWDETTQTMFANQYSTGALYTVNPNTGAFTMVGTGSATEYIDMTCTNEGQLYGLDMNSQYFGMIDKTNGAWTPLIPSPFYFIYAQGMTIDRDMDQIYWCAFNASTYQGQLWMADLVTNTFVFVGNFEGFAEVDGAAIAGGGSQVPYNLIGYNVYRDEQLIGSTDAETEEYTDGPPLAAGWYSYAVTALYDHPTPGESQIEGPVDVYVNCGESFINGTVYTYGSDPEPIPGATITIDGFTFVTGEGGSYSTGPICEGYYTITIEAEGYVTETVENVHVPFDQTVVLNFCLMEFPYPALSVTAVRNYQRTAVDLNWYEYSNFYQIIYDDGVADNVTAWDKAGNMNATRFTPAGYPAQIFAVEVNIYDGSWPPQGDILTPFRMALYDDDGEDGLPGTQLAIVDVTPYAFGWVYCDFSPADVTINSGDFYGVMIQGGDYPDCAPIAIDETNPVFRSYSQYISGNEPWRPASFADFMMRAYVYSGADGSQILDYNDKIGITEMGSPSIAMGPSNVKAGQYNVGFGKFIPLGEPGNNGSRAFDHYRVFVLPGGQEGNPDAWTLKTDSPTGTTYTDTDWPDYGKGWYRYAVVSAYTYNESEAAFSNLVPKDLDWDLTINVRTNSNAPVVGAQVTMTNENGQSQYIYNGIADENGEVFLHNVWEGIYTLEAFLEFYQPNSLQHIPVYNSMNINITLNDACLPPQQFKVNSQTGVATWLPPVLEYYTVFEEGFEGGVIPPGWTQEYVNESALWTVQTGSPGGIPDIAHTGQYNAAFYGTTVATRLITPEIDLGGELLPKLIFYHTQPAGEGLDELNIYYRVSTTTAWKPLTSYIENIPVWTREEISLPNPSAHYQIGFMGSTEEPAGNGICVDDVKVIAGINPTRGDGGERVLLGYNFYQNGVHIAFTTDLTYIFTDLVNGQFYVMGLDAQYSSCHSIIVEYPFTYYTCDYFEPPTEFQGQVNGMNVLLIWEPPAGIVYQEYQVQYDDGQPENAMAWYSAGGMTATRFSPGGYPAEIRKFHMNIFDGTWPTGDILTSMKIHIYDDDGGNGYPGTDLGSIEVTPTNYNWVEFDITSLGVAIGSGDFYLAHEQLHDYPNCPPTAIDESSSGQGRSYNHALGAGWSPGSYDQYMIRATVYSPFNGEQIREPLTVPTGGIPDETSVSAKTPAAPTGSGEVTLGSGRFAYPDGRTRFELKGYNVYKDGKVLNDSPLIVRSYLDVCSPGGIYNYNVTAVYDMGESCFLDPGFIAVVGADFPPPTGLTAEMLEGDDVLLTWNVPGTATDDRLTLLGYNLWRNGSNLHFVPAPDTFYIDPAVAPGIYTYYVSALYDMGESFADGPAVVAIVPKGGLTGLVYDATTMAPIAGATVTLEPGGFTTQIGNNGWYTFTGIEVGTYVVTATKATYTATSMNVTIAYNEIKTVYLPMCPESFLLPLPFYEPWDGGYFTENCWSFDPAPGNWQISTFTGNPAPAAEFYWAPFVNEYSFALVSVALDARYAMENMTLEFDLYLSVYGATGTEKMGIDVSDGEAWVRIDEITNTASIDWTHYVYDISQYVLGRITRVRFVAFGEDSFQINNWDMDNIQVHEVITATLQGTITSTETGDPIHDAAIAVPGYNTVSTNALGFYTINVVQGTYDVTASATGYLDQIEQGVYITDTTTLDFALEPEPCLPPLNLEGEVAGIYNVHLTWQSPSGGSSTDEWIHYDDGVNYDAIGLTAGGSFMVAIRFEPSQIAPYAGTVITEVKFFAGSTVVSTQFVLKIWKGANASILIYEQPIINPAIGDWSVIALNTPVPVDVTQELWIGYACNNSPAGEYPAGCDAGPAEAGYGDMITLDELLWEPLSGYGLNYNWNLQAHVVGVDSKVAELVPIAQKPLINSVGARPAKSGIVNTTPEAVDNTVNSRSLMGYNVYRDNVKINDALVLVTQYTDVDLEFGTYTYYVTAQYTFCESEPSNSVVIVDCCGINEFSNSMIHLYPVPAKDYVNVEVSDDICEFRVLNYIGQVVIEQNVVKEKTFWINTSTLISGTYLIEFMTENGSTTTKRLVIVR